MKKQNQTQEEFERIERYLDGLMDQEEQSAFEASLKTDSILNQQFEEVRLLRLAIEEQSLRNKLNDFHEEIISEDAGSQTNGVKTKTIFAYKAIAIAASLALLMGFGYWLLFGQQSANERLYAEYFKPDPGLLTPMSTTTEYDFYRGMVDYKQEKYGEAINRWKPLAEQKPENDTLNFYLGVSFLAKDETDEAIAYLSKAVRVPSSTFIDEAWYYLGMAQLKEGQSEEAIQAFRKSKLENSRLILKEIVQTE